MKDFAISDTSQVVLVDTTTNKVVSIGEATLAGIDSRGKEVHINPKEQEDSKEGSKLLPINDKQKKYALDTKTALMNIIEREFGVKALPSHIDIAEDHWPNRHNCDYQIIRSSTHDGTLLFTIDKLYSVLTPLINKTSIHKDYVGKNIKDVSYSISPEILVEEDYSVRGRVTETMSLPVKVYYEFYEEESQ